MNGKGHALTTLAVSFLVAKWLMSMGVGQIYATVFVVGAFLTCHSANVWGIHALSPDADLLFERLLGVRIHRKWYFHSFILSLPLFAVGTHLIGVNPMASVFSFGMAFGWNAHIIEDDIWSRLKHHRKQPFPFWVEVTSTLALIVAVAGVLANADPRYGLFFKIIENII